MKQLLFIVTLLVGGILLLPGIQLTLAWGQAASAQTKDPIQLALIFVLGFLGAPFVYMLAMLAAVIIGRMIDNLAQWREF
jgi:F0F1-type ATP synthase membrane subunit c/vacuolar-type H+-ATPase subunit K